MLSGNHNGGLLWFHATLVNPLAGSNRANAFPVRCVQHLPELFSQRNGRNPRKRIPAVVSSARRLLLRLFGVVDQNAAAILADDDFLALTDVDLTLGRDAVVAAAAGIALDRHHG